MISSLPLQKIIVYPFRSHSPVQIKVGSMIYVHLHSNLASSCEFYFLMHVAPREWTIGGVDRAIRAYLSGFLW